MPAAPSRRESDQKPTTHRRSRAWSATGRNTALYPHRWGPIPGNPEATRNSWAPPPTGSTAPAAAPPCRASFVGEAAVESLEYSSGHVFTVQHAEITHPRRLNQRLCAVQLLLPVVPVSPIQIPCTCTLLGLQIRYGILLLLPLLLFLFLTIIRSCWRCHESRVLIGSVLYWA